MLGRTSINHDTDYQTGDQRTYHYFDYSAAPPPNSPKVEVTVPVVDADEACRIMAAHADKWVAVFWDRGWGDDDIDGNPLEISIIVDGKGQQPLAYITSATYRQLLDDGRIDENSSLLTHKARKLHVFTGERVTR